MDGSEPILDEMESAALLDVIQATRNSSSSYESVDLTSPELALRDVLREVEQGGVPMADAFRRVLLQQLGAPLKLRALPVDRAIYSMLREGYAPRSGCVAFTIDGRAGGWFVLGPKLRAYVTRQLLGAGDGGADDLDDDAEPPPLSTLLRRVMTAFAGAIAGRMLERWVHGPLNAEIQPFSAEFAPLPEVAPDALFVTLRWNLELSEGKSDDCLLAINYEVVRAARMKAQLALQAGAPPHQYLRESILESTVKAIAVLGRTQSTVRDVVELAEGDVVRLDTETDPPLDVHVGGIVFVRGKPVVHAGSLAIEVTEIAKTE